MRGGRVFLRGLRPKWEFRRIRNLLFLGFGIWFLYAVIASDQGILRIISLKQQIEKTEGTISLLKAEQDSLKRELSGLENIA